MKVIKLIFMLFTYFAIGCAIPEANSSGGNLNGSAHLPVKVLDKNADANRPNVRVQETGSCLSFEPEVVELEGSLITQMFYGPPNFGEKPETDVKENVPILVLSEPVNVCGVDDPKARPLRPSFEKVRRIQLVLKVPYGKFSDKAIIARGTLFPANTGHHHTDVLMDVESIDIAGSAKARGH